MATDRVVQRIGMLGDLFELIDKMVQNVTIEEWDENLAELTKIAGDALAVARGLSQVLTALSDRRIAQFAGAAARDLAEFERGWDKADDIDLSREEP